MKKMLLRIHGSVSFHVFSRIPRPSRNRSRNCRGDRLHELRLLPPLLHLDDGFFGNFFLRDQALPRLLQEVRELQEVVRQIRDLCNKPSFPSYSFQPEFHV